MNAVERAQQLAENEDLEVLWSALHSALEADLSSKGWRGVGSDNFERVCKRMDRIVTEAEKPGQGKE